MDNPRPEKVAVVEEIRDRLSAAPAAIFAEYRGLTVKDLGVLRRQLDEAGGKVKVYKNTLARFAAAELGLAIEEVLSGPTAITFVEADPGPVAKVLRDFARTNPLLVIKGGLLGDRAIDADAARSLADLPSREVVLSQIAGLLEAPLQQLAGLLEAVPRTFAYGLQALVDKQGGEPEAAPEAGAEAPEQEAAPAADAEAPAAETESPAAEAPAEEASAEEASTEEASTEEASTEEAPAAEAPAEEPAAETTEQEQE